MARYRIGWSFFFTAYLQYLFVRMGRMFCSICSWLNISGDVDLSFLLRTGGENGWTGDRSELGWRRCYDMGGETFPRR
jgi:hypothetical protein